MNHAASDGVSVSASTSDVSSDTTIVSASARKNTPVMPDKNASGMNTTTGVSVEPISGVKISPMASWIPASRGRPAAIFTHIASTTMIALSISSPMDAAMPPSVIMLKLMPASFMAMSVIRTVIGIVTMAVHTLPQFFRKK